MSDFLVFKLIKNEWYICCYFFYCVITLKYEAVENRALRISSLMSNRFCNYVFIKIDEKNFKLQRYLIENEIENFVILNKARRKTFVNIRAHLK